MRNIFFLCLAIIGLHIHTQAQKNKPIATVEKISIQYQGKKVRAKKLTVSSQIPMPIDRAWSNVKTPALLQFVAQGMIRFKATDEELPPEWQYGQTYSVKMRVFGFIPFGGKHYLLINEIDDQQHQISTKEWDKRAKVWNHTISLRDSANGDIHYQDTIAIYGGMLTGFITSFAKKFYKHRQKRWQIVARENLSFGE
jgi:hypothetical protein